MNNQIKESYVTFEIAQALKGKSFDCLCSLYMKEGEDIQHVTLGRNTFNDNRIYIPTTALAIAWIRENFGINIYVECETYGEEYYPKIASASEKTWQDLDLRSEILNAKRVLLQYKTYEAAEQAALLYTLKNLV